MVGRPLRGRLLFRRPRSGRPTIGRVGVGYTDGMGPPQERLPSRPEVQGAPAGQGGLGECIEESALTRRRFAVRVGWYYAESPFMEEGPCVGGARRRTGRGLPSLPVRLLWGRFVTCRKEWQVTNLPHVERPSNPVGEPTGRGRSGRLPDEGLAVRTRFGLPLAAVCLALIGCTTPGPKSNPANDPDAPFTGAKLTKPVRDASTPPPEADVLLAGQVVEKAFGKRVANASIQVIDLEDPAPAARLDVSANADGYFFIPGLQRGHHYQLIGRIKDGDHLLSGMTLAAPPNPRLSIYISADLTSPSTPAPTAPPLPPAAPAKPSGDKDAPTPPAALAPPSAVPGPGASVPASPPFNKIADGSEPGGFQSVPPRPRWRSRTDRRTRCCRLLRRSRPRRRRPRRRRIGGRRPWIKCGTTGLPPAPRRRSASWWATGSTTSRSRRWKARRGSSAAIRRGSWCCSTSGRATAARAWRRSPGLRLAGEVRPRRIGGCRDRV